MSWTLQIREKVKKRFQRLPAKDQRKIREALFVNGKWGQPLFMIYYTYAKSRENRCW